MAEKEINTRTLGGWLILIQIFIILNAISWAGNLQVYYKLLGDKDNYLKEKGITNTGTYTAFVYYELAASLLFTFGAFAVFYYFFKRNTYFPLIMTIYLIIEVITETVSFFLFSHLSTDPSLMIQKLAFSAVIAIFVIVYLRISKRVKLTFIF
jgi:hypothetical protein